MPARDRDDRGHIDAVTRRPPRQFRAAAWRRAPARCRTPASAPLPAKTAEGRIAVRSGIVRRPAACLFEYPPFDRLIPTLPWRSKKMRQRFSAAAFPKQNSCSFHRTFIVIAILVIFHDGGDGFQREPTVCVLHHILQIE